MDLNTAIQKSIFLLGAGASYGIQENRTGCKTSSEMFDDLQEMLSTPDLHEISEIEAEAFRFLISTLHFQNSWRRLEKNSKNKFNPNIEELALIIRRIKNRDNYLPYPLTGNWADKLIQLESSYRNTEGQKENLFEKLEFLLKTKLLAKWLTINDSALDYLDPLAALMSSTNLGHSIQCYTLNYDETIERFLHEKHSVTPYCGFISGDWAGPKNKESVGFDKLNLYKLHGSLNWVRLNNSGKVKLKDNLEDEEIEDIDPRHNPYLIFGHGTKTFSFDPFFSLINSFKEALSIRPYCFTIGYSFFDPYINNLLIEALNSNEIGKLIIVNPTFGPIHNEINYEKDEHGFVKLIDGRESSKVLAEYIEEIQKNSFYSELPEFNIAKINGTNRIQFLNIGFGEFLIEYFMNDGQRIITLIERFEKEKEEESPF